MHCQPCSRMMMMNKKTMSNTFTMVSILSHKYTSSRIINIMDLEDFILIVHLVMELFNESMQNFNKKFEVHLESMKQNRSCLIFTVDKSVKYPFLINQKNELHFNLIQ